MHELFITSMPLKPNDNLTSIIPTSSFRFKIIASFLILFLPIQYGYSQKSFTKEIGTYTDNDAYSNLFNDGYYTAGITLFYKYIPENNDSTKAKKIIEWNFGMKIYTPEEGDAPRMIDQDRPFAGYLFGSGFIHHFYKNESVLKYGATLGIVGPGSGIGKTQINIHKFFNFYELEGWEYQIKNLLALNAHFMFSKKIVHFCKNRVDLHSFVQINAGTVETNAGFGIMNRLSVFAIRKVNRSSIFEGLADFTTTRSSQIDPEFFLFVRPLIIYRFYDATIQGSMFNQNSPVTYDIEPVLFSLETGIMFQLNRFNLKYSVTFNSREVLNNKVERQTYGTINVSYLF